MAEKVGLSLVTRPIVAIGYDRGVAPPLQDPYDRDRYPRLSHREWVLMFQQGITPEKIAALNNTTSGQVRAYLGQLARRQPELFNGRLARVL